jgi:imidazolonepropionase-like amidohydrolase
VLAGTDNIDTWVFTGASLHDELAMLVDAGLSPLEALQAATLHPARFAQLENEFGTIEAGQRADLVLLNANPLVDIRNTSDIEGVMFEGQYFDRQALDTLEAYAIEMAQSFRVNLRLLFDMFSSAPMRAQLAD